MKNEGEGWFEIIEKRAGPGTLYRYRIDQRYEVPDPASRFQPLDAEGPSEVIDPGAFAWDDAQWKGWPWREAVIYELHVGGFSSRGDYAGVIGKLDHLAKLGVTAIELMPLADFCGARNWGYDGVLPYAPDSRYGRPEALKALVRAAHRAGLMVLLDVVYNHFGPKGNFLQRYAPQFFTGRHATPWGAAIDFSNPWVRRYFVHNARYWLEEYRFDGLRLDAVHAIADDSPRHILEEIAQAVPRGKHLVLENDANQADFLKGGYAAQWNDDAHHACHVLATGEAHGYYADYTDAPARHLARCLAEGFAFQGEVSAFRKKPRGQPSSDLHPAAFINFLQNHDQVGNRAHGDRLVSISGDKAVKVLSAILLLAPSPPLLFMGEEWGCRQPFLFFCDFGGELGDAVREGRRREFPHFKSTPDPLAVSTFKRSVLRWKDAHTAPARAWLAHYGELLKLRSEVVASREFGPGRYRMLGSRAFEVRWDDLLLLANCGEQPVLLDFQVKGRLLWGTQPDDRLDGWSVSWWLAA